MQQFFLILFSLTVLSIKSQTLNYRNYSVENGLASSTVYAAIQDRKGFMWFCTENGVNRFDGNSFENFTVEDGLSDNDVFRLFEDSKGRIWFLTSNGRLSFFEDGKIHNEKTDSFLTKMRSASGFFYAVEDSRNRIWFCSINSQISVLNKNDVFCLQAPSPHTNAGVAVFEDRKKAINILCESDRYVFNEENKSLTRISPFSGAVHSSYFRSPSGQMYCFNYGKVYQLSNDSFNMVYSFLNTDLTRFDILSATNGNNNSIYICSKKGVINIVPGTSHFKNFLPDKWVNSVTVDKEENMWFMTRGNGIYYLPQQYLEQKIYDKSSLKNDDILSLTVGSEGSIWMGYTNNSVGVLKNNRLENISLPVFKNRSGRVIYMDTDKEGNIWCCTDFCFYKVNGQNHTVKMLADTNAIRTVNVSFNSKGSVVLALSTFIGRITENKNRLYINQLDDSSLNKRTYGVFYDNVDHLYISNINGLYKKSNNTIVNLSGDDPLLNSKIISIGQTQDSSLVLGTDGFGVLFYKNGKIISHITSKEGLSSSICQKIRIYQDKVFVCTNRGLTQFTYRNGVATDFKIYGESYGLPTGNVRDVILEKGILYVATSKGLAEFEENASLRMVSPPGIYIKDVLNNMKQVNFDSSFTLPFRNNTITIKYSAITFSNPDEVIYEYSTHKNSTAIKHTRLTELTFPDLSPGNYTFSIRAKKKNSNWSAFTGFSFNVEYPYYLRWWFYLLVTFSLISGLTLVFIYLHRRSMQTQLFTLERRNALNVERNRISADMHDDLGADLSRIVLISELMNLASKKDQSLQSNLSKIYDYATGATKKMDEIIWALNPQNDTLQSLFGYINQYCLNFFDGTDIKVEVDDELVIDMPLNAKQRRNIFLVIKEIANNALKHADADKFFIKFKVANNILFIIAGENGKGFEDSDAIKSGNGLKNISKRINELQGSVTRKSAPFQGTTYEIFLHLNGGV